MKSETNYKYIKELDEILNKNIDKRICVVGTSCTGKSTYLEATNNGLDMDEIIFPLLSKEEKEYVCQIPWTEEIGQKMDELVKERIKIQAGKPVFGTVVIDCDLIVYLKISEELLRSRTASRKVKYEDAKNMQNSIEKELEKVSTPIIVLDVKEQILDVEEQEKDMER